MALENVITTLVLDVIDHDQTQGVVKAIALDSKTLYVQATIVRHGLDYDVDPNAAVTLTILRPDNVGVQVTGSVVDVDNSDRTGTIKGVFAELTQAALAVKGNLKAQFMLKSGDQVLRTEIFTISCGEALDASTDTWAGEYQGYNLDELVQNVNESSAKVDAMEQDVSELKSGLSDLQDGGYVADAQKIQEKIDNYLDEHPEATTTVQDGSVTEAKFSDALKLKTIKDYVTPEMYGAKGDGTTDDTEAIQSALASGRDVYFGQKTYCVSETLVLAGSISMCSDTTIKAIATMASVFSATNIGDRLRFIGGVIDCNSNANSGIALSGVNGAYIQNLKILNAVDSSIDITSGAHNWVIGCKLYNRSTMAKGIESNSPDLKIVDCEIYYTECGIEQTYGILFVANTHIWSGGTLNESTSSVGIRMSAQANPRLFANSLYLDSFYVGVDFGTAVGDLKMSSCLFYWTTTTTPQECYGVKLGANSNINLNNCLFQTYSPIVKHDILYGTQIIDYSEPKKDATADFGVTSNASKTILTATVIKGILYVDFVVKILALTADSTNWYPIIESVSLPSERMLISRLDFAVFNNTKNKGAIARIGVFTTDNIIRIHVNGDLSINDVIYGSIAIPIV